MKVCSKCLIEKEDSFFYKNRNSLRTICKECDKQKAKIWNKENKEKHRKHQEKFRKTSKGKDVASVYKYRNNKYNTDVLYRVKTHISNNIRKLLKKLSSRKNNKTQEILGLKSEEFKKHLENQFTEGMTWDNYGVINNGWTIDHICPSSQAKNIDELYKLQNYRNLRPIWHKENSAKCNKPTIEAMQKCTELLNREWIYG